MPETGSSLAKGKPFPVFPHNAYEPSFLPPPLSVQIPPPPIALPLSSQPLDRSAYHFYMYPPHLTDSTKSWLEFSHFIEQLQAKKNLQLRQVTTLRVDDQGEVTVGDEIMSFAGREVPWDALLQHSGIKDRLPVDLIGWDIFETKFLFFAEKLVGMWFISEDTARRLEKCTQHLENPIHLPINEAALECFEFSRRVFGGLAAHRIQRFPPSMQPCGTAFLFAMDFAGDSFLPYPKESYAFDFDQVVPTVAATVIPLDGVAKSVHIQDYHQRIILQPNVFFRTLVSDVQLNAIPQLSVEMYAEVVLAVLPDQRVLHLGFLRAPYACVDMEGTMPHLLQRNKAAEKAIYPFVEEEKRSGRPPMLPAMLFGQVLFFCRYPQQLRMCDLSARQLHKDVHGEQASKAAKATHEALDSLALQA